MNLVKAEFEEFFEVGQFVQEWDWVFSPLWEVYGFKRIVLTDIYVSRK